MTALAPSLPTPRLVRAEVLKLRKRRGLVAITACLTVGAALVTCGILAILHWANPAHHGPAGGVVNLGHGLFVLGILGAVAATLVGATAGAGDLNAGIFRELVATGRSRRALFRARIPGGSRSCSRSKPSRTRWPRSRASPSPARCRRRRSASSPRPGGGCCSRAPSGSRSPSASPRSSARAR